MIHLNITNVGAGRLGLDHGLDEDYGLEQEFAAWEDSLAKHSAALFAQKDDNKGFLGWIDLPYYQGEAMGNQVVDPILDYAAALSADIRDLVVLGIGGSSLGALAVITALQHPYRHLQAQGEGLRVHFVDNVDPDSVQALLGVLEPQHTLVNVISKSGTTAETMAAYLLFRDWLERALGAGHVDHIVATTDPSSGILRPLAEREGYATFSVPPNVGGRFSVFSAVGLLPIALAGIDIKALLDGAAEANSMLSYPIAESPVKQMALIQYLAYRRGKTISVLMPYSSRLRYIANWYVQLWAESLGKAVNRAGSLVHEGSTPLAAIGATDQHSQVQLFNEGPNNKIFTFIRINSFDQESRLPAVGEGLEKLSYLSEKSLSSLINAEQSATAYAIFKHGRPNYTLSLDKLDAYHLGMLLQMLEWQTALMGELTDIDTYNQPGVELGKVYTYALMGREGFDAERQELAEAGVED